MDTTWMTSHGQFFYRIFFILSLATEIALGDCPPSNIQKAQDCTKLVGYGFSPMQPQTFISKGAAERAKHACGNGDLLDVVSCMERVVAQCADSTTDTAHFLRNMINSTRARNSILYFCNNLKEYAASANCLTDHQNLTSQCAKAAIMKFRTQYQATDNIDAQMRFSCSLFYTTVDCTEKTASAKCGGASADIVKTVLRGFEPPICTTMTYRNGETGSLDSSQADQGGTGNGSGGIVVSCFVLLICSFVLSSAV